MVGVLRCHRRPVRTGHIDMDDEGGGRGGSKVERVMSAARLLPRPQTLRLYATAIISPLTSTRTRLVNARPREMPAGVLHVCPRRVGSCHAMLGKSRCRFSNAETRAWLRFGCPSECEGEKGGVGRSGEDIGNSTAAVALLWMSNLISVRRGAWDGRSLLQERNGSGNTIVVNPCQQPCPCAAAAADRLPN